jgi:hypothetical protein
MARESRESAMAKLLTVLVVILALGFACRQAPHDELAPSARGLVGAMGPYNAGVMAVLVYGAVSVGVARIALWPAVVATCGHGRLVHQKRSP